MLGHGAASEAVGMRKGDLSGKILSQAIIAAIQASNLHPSDIDHVNAHGSSLPDYDVCDSNAFKEAFGTHAYKIPIVSIKSMIGQPVSAAGALQAAAACLSIRYQRVPPTINQEVSDPRCDLDYVPNHKRQAKLTYVMSNSFGFGGHNACLILGQPAGDGLNS